MKPGDIIDTCGKLRSIWTTRNTKIKAWYEFITLRDDLKQEGMESVVSNDPRTGYNLAKHLMTASTRAHRISTDELTAPEVAATSYLEKYVTKRWNDQEVRYRRMGRQSFVGEFVGFMLAAGWYSIFSMVDGDRIWCEVWNPYEVFPRFSSDGLIEVAHIYTLSPQEANRKAKLMEWNIKPVSHRVNLYNYWGFDSDGDVVNSIVLGTDFVKEP